MRVASRRSGTYVGLFNLDFLPGQGAHGKGEETVRQHGVVENGHCTYSNHSNTYQDMYTSERQTLRHLAHSGGEVAASGGILLSKPHVRLKRRPTPGRVC